MQFVEQNTLIAKLYKSGLWCAAFLNVVLPAAAQTNAVNSANNAAPSLTPEQIAADAQLLRSWQQQTGQSVLFSGNSAGAGQPGDAGKVEFHGEIGLGGYHSRVSIPSGNTALSTAKSGDFGKLVFQGDVRTTNAELDTTYAQGSFTSTDDRGLQPRYATQVNNLQIGRSGVGYQVALGDVAANFSSLSSNLGLRGALLSKDFGAFTATGFAGVVADSWEALANQDSRDSQSARTRNLRDVAGLKGEYKFINQNGSPDSQNNTQLSAYATVQNYRDRPGTASPLSSLVPLPVGTVIGPLTTLEGTLASLGSKYNQGNFLLTAELAASRTTDQTTDPSSTAVAPPDSTGNALLIDANYKIGSVNLRAGHHNVDANFTSLSQSGLPGVRETYLASDWQITPQLLWGVDLRTAIARTPAFGAAVPTGSAGGASPNYQSSLDSLTNRVSYSLQDISGLAFSLLDTRSKGVDIQRNDNRNDSTQLGASYASPSWSANALLGVGHSRNAGNTLYDSNSTNWQLFTGRNWGNDSRSETFGIQGTLGAQVQRFAAGTSSRSNNFGLNLQSTSGVGTFNASWQRQTTTQPVAGTARLSTNSYSLEWSKDITSQWNAKAYARANRRNHGDALLQSDESVVGVQGIYRW